MATKVVHCKRSPYDVYVGRGSEWGNPFSHKPSSSARWRVATREEAISRYRQWLLTSPDAEELRARVGELSGKTLGCWCAPRPCHGDVLAELADAP